MSLPLESLGQLLSDDGFVPRRFCGVWPDWLVWEHVAGNALIWTAYTAVPLLIWRLGHQKLRKSAFAGPIGAFALFIALCGIGHLLDMIAFYHPLYRLSGHVLVATGLVSWWTVWVLARAWPTFSAMKGPAEVEQATLQRTEELRHALEEMTKAEAERAYLATIVLSSHDAIVSKDLSGIVTSWNRSAERLFGYSSDEAVGQPIAFLIPPERLQEDAAVLEKLRNGETVAPFESVRLAKDRRRIEVSLTISPIKDRAGRIIGISKIIRDITHQNRVEEELRRAKETAEIQKRVEEELRRAKQIAEDADRSKDRFLATLSHELRTPLTPVLATIEHIESTANLPESLSQEIATIRRNVEFEASLIDDLLDLTRIVQGKLELHLEVIDVHQALRTALEFSQAEADAKRLEITMSLRAPCHLVRADKSRLQQIFWNLIKNAVKFTPDEGSISIRSTDIGSGRIAIEVADSGEGIEPENLSRIFDAFEQGGRDVTRRHGGLGLGLAIVRTLVDAHGGSLTVASRGKDQGSLFRVVLDLCDEAKDPDPPVEPLTLNGESLRILFVEDNADTRQAVSAIMSAKGHLVRPVKTVAEAMSALSHDNFDLLVSDIGLPDGSGLDIMRYGRDKYGLKGIAFSGYGSREEVNESLAAGFSYHLTKPSGFKLLIDTIRRTAS